MKMRTSFSVLLGLSFLFLLAASASAAVTVSKSELLVEANYALFNDEDQKTISRTTDSFTLTNTGTEEAVLSYSITGLPNGYSTETKSVTVAAGATSEALQLNVNIPHQQDSGKNSIGILTVTQAGATVASIPVKQDTLPLLELDRVEVEFTDEDGEVQTTRFSETETVYKIDENILIGTPLKLTIKVKNLFDRDYDEISRDVSDIELTLNPSEDEVFSEEVDDNVFDFGALDASESKELEIVLQINPEADVDEYMAEITLEGEDGEGSKHMLERVLEFEIIRKRDDVRIVKAEVQPATLTCEREATVKVELKNYGAREQVFAELLIFNQELGIRRNVGEIKVGEYGETTSVWKNQFTFVIPADAKKGVHYFDLTAFARRDVDTDSERVPFTVGGCVEEEVPADTINNPSGAVVANANAGDDDKRSEGSADKKEENDAEKDEEKEVTDGSQSDVVKTVERISFNPTPDQLWIAGLAVIAVLLVAMNALLIILFMKR